MQPSEIRQLRERFALLAAAEREELQQTPLEVKFRQLAALMQSALALGWDMGDEREDRIVRERWRRLRAQHRG